MGQNQSADVIEAVDGVEQDLGAQAPKQNGIKLYRFISANQEGKWELATANARPHFYNALEDANESGKKADWFLEIDGSDVDTRLDQEAGFVFNAAQRRITFCANTSVWAMKLPDEEAFKSFSVEWNNKFFHNTYGYENDEKGRTKVLGDDFAKRMYNIDGLQQASEPMDVEAEADQSQTPDKLKERTARDGDDEDDPIMGVIMGANDNSYLLKSGGKFDVLRNVLGAGVEDKGITFSLTPAKGSRTPNFTTPSRVLLTQGERRMNLLTPEHPNLLHHADVETGKIVNTFSFQKETVEIPIKDISHDNKSSQMEETSTFLGLDNNRLCRWDLRDPRGRVAESPVVNYQDGRDYSRGTNFTCMATSGDGYVVVGSQDGQIRLYSSKSLSRANTSIPGMGAPITAVDVTYDGKWVVATTNHYLMVVKTTFETEKGQSTGFTSRMGARGSMPRLLRLRPEDVAKTGGKPLSKGKFSWITESGHSERWIVASCGKYSVIWNFTKVKSSTGDGLSFGGLATNMDYILTSKEEDVVDAAFQHQRYAPDADASIVVATQHSLFNLGG